MKNLKKYESFVDIDSSKGLTENEFNSLLSEKCSQFDWNDKPIFRCLTSESYKKYAFINSSESYRTYTHDGKQYRASMASPFGNYAYTVLMNHLPCWKDYPKRQLICSTSMNLFQGSNYLYRVIPFDGSKWGIVPKDDIHGIMISKTELAKNLINLKMTRYIQDFTDLSNAFNYGWKKFVTDWDGLLKFCKMVDTSKTPWEKSESPAKPLTIEMLNELFTPEKFGFDCMDYDEFKNCKLPNENRETYVATSHNENGHEVWTDSNVLLCRVNIDYRREKDPSSTKYI